MRQLSPPRALTLAVVVVAAGACAQGPTARTPAPTGLAAIVVTQDLPNGRVQVRLLPSYPIGEPVVVPATITVTRGSVTGPVRARILASGIGERGAPSEVVVRTLAPAPVMVTPGVPRTVAVTWDGRDDLGASVPADAYVVILEFRSDAGSGSLTSSAAVTVQLGR